MRHQILLVREWDSQTGSSGCCGRLGGDELGGRSEFERNRCEMESMGTVYRALKQELSDDEVEINVVDPRNMTWLVPSLWRSARRRNMPVREILTQLSRGVSYSSIVVDGRVLFSREAPAPEEAVDAVRAEIKAVEEQPSVVGR